MGETTEQAECHIHSRELEILENVFNVLLKLCVCVCVISQFFSLSLACCGLETLNHPCHHLSLPL